MIRLPKTNSRHPRVHRHSPRSLRHLWSRLGSGFTSIVDRCFQRVTLCRPGISRTLNRALQAAPSELQHTHSAEKRESKRRPHNRNKRHQTPPLPCLYDVLEPKRVLSATFPTFVRGELTMGNRESSAPYGLANTFELSSLPDAEKTIYLDFTGHHSHSNGWRHNIRFPAFNFNGNSSSFSNAERIRIQQIYQNVAEDFLPFNVNVTTKAPPQSDLVRSNGSDHRFGVRVVFTRWTEGFGYGYGGLARYNTFRANSDTPVFVFEAGENNSSIIASHEVGHSLGLRHDGYYNDEYHRGSRGWGPLMGAPYGHQLSQWSNGDYAGSTSRQDDVRILGSQLGRRTDQVADNLSAASTLVRSGSSIRTHGIIESRADVDAYQFQVNHDGDVEFLIRPFQGRGNLDVLARLYDANGTIVATSNPTQRLSASFSLALNSGKYYLTVEGTGKNGVYSDYGSLGLYTIEGEINDQNLIEIGYSGFVKNVTHEWQSVVLPRNFKDPVVIAGPSSNQGAQPATIRIRNVRSNSFEIKIDEWDYLDQVHSPETLSFLVVESGTHELPDGTTLVAGNGYLNHVARRIGYGQILAEKPIVFSQVVSDNGGSAVTTRVFNVDQGGFNLRLQEQEAADGLHSFEQFSWLAIEPTKTASQQVLESRRLKDYVSHNNRQFDFQSDFEQTPVLLAATQTIRANDVAVLRYKYLTRRRSTIFLNEEQSKDQEQRHAFEQVGILAMQRGSLQGVKQQAPQAISVEPNFDGTSATGIADADPGPTESGLETLLPSPSPTHLDANFLQNLDNAFANALKQRWIG